jgi:hypothetical protein
VNANDCPRCHKPIPETVLRDIGRGTSCPSCSAPLKRTTKVNTTPPPSPKPAAAAAMKPAAVATAAAGPKNLRATMVGAAIAPREMPFNGTPAPGAFALSAPVTAPPVRAAAPPLPSLRAVPASVSPSAPAAAPAPAALTPPAPAATPPAPPPARLPLPGSVPAPASRGLGTVSQLVTASDSEPTHVAQSPRGLATVSPLVTASDEEPTNVVLPPHEQQSVAPSLGDGDSEAIASVTIRPDSAPVFAPVTLQPVQRRRGLAIIGVGMGLAIVALFVVGVKIVGSRKTNPPVAPAEVASPAAESTPPAPIVEAVQPPPAPQPPPPRAAKAPPARSPPPVAVAKQPPVVPAAKPIVEKRGSSRHRTKAHHRREPRGRKVALQAPAAKRSPPPPPEHADPRPPYERGNALLFAGDGKGAISAYREAVKSAPSDPIGFRGLGLAYEQQGETASAIRALRRYLKLAPNAADREIISRRIDRLAKRAKQK